MQNYYDILGIEKTASPTQITRAYRTLARQYHPDRVQNAMQGVDKATLETQKEANKSKFQTISEAYRVLHDPEQRITYDKSNNSDSNQSYQQPVSTNYDEFFSNLPELSIEACTLQLLLKQYHCDLDTILAKAKSNFRYQAILGIIQNLKNDLSSSATRHLGDLDTKTHIPIEAVYRFLMEIQEKIKAAQDTKQPEIHRGFLWGTTIIRELLAPLIYALMRLILFVSEMIFNYLDKKDPPAFEGGFIYGLFKKPRTRTEYVLIQMKENLGLYVAETKSIIDIYEPNTEGSFHFFHRKRDNYFEDEFCNFSHNK